MPTLTAREFEKDIAGARKAADKGPVVIMESGVPAYVLIRHATYQRLTEQGQGLRALLAHPESEDFDFEPPRLGDQPVAAAPA